MNFRNILRKTGLYTEENVKKFTDQMLTMHITHLQEVAGLDIQIKNVEYQYQKDVSEIVQELFMDVHPNLAIGCTIVRRNTEYKLKSVTFKYELPHPIAVMILQPIGIKSLPHKLEMRYDSFRVKP